MKLCALVMCCLLPAVALSDSTGKPQPPKGSKQLDREIRLGEDEVGCKDTAFFSRLPGCNIIQCDTKEADTIEIQVGASSDGIAQKEGMDGPSEVIYYLCPSKLSLSHIAKTSEAVLSKAGFKPVFSGKDDDDQPLVTLLKDTQWVQVSTYMYNEYSAYIVSAIRVDPESQAGSEALGDEMSKNGRLVLYGLGFAAGKPDLPPEAERALAEVAAFLVRQPGLRIRVEGHAADAPDAAANATLSKQRASAVAAWLLDHGVDKTRISIDGAGDTKPDPDGAKSRNQRVEIQRVTGGN